nr:hypothetical protein [Tanacetum cinerariifolium]
MPVCSNSYPVGLFADPTRSVTPFVRWIKDYPLPDGLKIPSHVGSYNRTKDLDNFQHLYEGAIRIIKQTEVENVRAFATRYTNDTLQILGLHEDQRISGFVHGLKARNLVEHLSTDLLPTYKGLMEKTYTWIEAREVATNGALNDRRDNFKRSRKSSWDNDRGQRSRDRPTLPPCKRNQEGKDKNSDNQRGEKKEKSTTPTEAPILMIDREETRTRNNIYKGLTFKGREITFPLVTKGSNSSASVIIKAKIFGREVSQVHMDS